MPNVVRIPVAAGAFDPSDITLTDDTSGALLIKEGSNEYMRIDTTNTQEKTIFKTQSGANTGFFVNTPIVGDALSIIRGGSPATFIRLNAGTTLFQVDSNQILADLISDPRTFKVDGTNVSPLVITGDSNATFTLDDGSGATFKVVDDGASPYTYLSATEGENCVRMNALRTDSSGRLQFQNSTGTTFFEIYQNAFIQQYIKPREYKTITTLTGSGASQSTTIDFRLGNVRGVQHLRINHGYSGTQTVTLNFDNSLSAFAGWQDWGVNSLLVMVENLTTGQDVTFQIRETTGGTTTFIDHTGASLSDPTGSGSLTLKNAGAASGKNFITFRVSQFNNSHGSASMYDDDRYIVEALTAELY